MIVSQVQKSFLLQNVTKSGSNRTVGTVDDEALQARRIETAQKGAAGAIVSAPVLENPWGNSLGNLLARIDMVQDALDKLLKSFPPFFPIGTYQRMDWIMEIRDIQAEVEQLSAENENLPFFMPMELLTETSNDDEIVGALGAIFQFHAEADALMKQGETSTLSIKV